MQNRDLLTLAFRAQADNILANYFGPLFGVDLSCIADRTTVSPAAEDGVYLMVAPLSAGHHVIHFTVQGFLDITYDLTVAPSRPHWGPGGDRDGWDGRDDRD